MEFLIGVVMVALVVGLVWLRIVGTRALNRHVFSRGQHAQDQDQTGRGPVITSSAAPGPQGALRHSAWFGCPSLTGFGGWR